MSTVLKRVAMAVILSATLTSLSAQSDKAWEYVNRVTASEHQITSEMLGYISAVAHSKSAKKVSKERSEAISAISAARAKASHLPDFEGDSAMRVASYDYFNVCYIVMKEDYGKIMDMEEIADQSYDNMEAYIKAQELANDKESEAFEKFDRELRAFAAKHNITINDDNSKEGQQAKIAGKVTKYTNGVFLTFYKCESNEKHLMQAIDKKDINGIEQSRGALVKSCEEALPKLQGIGGYEGDATMIEACKKLIAFYKSEAEKTPVMTDYILKNDNFQKLKTAMDKKGGSASQDEADKFNQSVNEINAAVNVYNKANNELNQNRARLVDNYNNTHQAFMAKHVPRHK